MPPLGTPLAGSTFNLNSAGVAGFFGGKEAISAMATVHLYKGRRWVGWYNSPGSYTVAKRFGRMANSRFWDGLFPGPNDSPAASFGLDGKPGPTYIAALSGTTMKTAHLGYLTVEKSRETRPRKIPGRETTPICISYLAMREVNYETPVEREPVNHALFAIIPITVSLLACVFCGLVYDWVSLSMILLGVVSSGVASLVIGEGRLVIKSVNKPAKGSPPGHGILMGEDEMVVIKGKERDVNAITKGHFDLDTDPRLQAGKQKGDGQKSDAEKGEKGKGECVGDAEKEANERIGDEGSRGGGKGGEGKDGKGKDDERIDVGEEAPREMGGERGGESSVEQDNDETHVEEMGDEGRKPDKEMGDKRKHDEESHKEKDHEEKDDDKGMKQEMKRTVRCYHAIGFSSLLLILQFLTQLLLVPQGTLFGQVMFLSSLCVSWVYNSFLSSLEKEKIQMGMLFKALGEPKMVRFRVGTRTTMAVFGSLLLFHEAEVSSPEDEQSLRQKILNSCIPNDTAVWRRWKEKVVDQLLHLDDASLSYLKEDDVDKGFREPDRQLLGQLLGDARSAFKGYFKIRQDLPKDSTQQQAHGQA